MRWLSPARVGMSVRSKLADMGYGARLFLTLLSMLGDTLRRPRLLVEQVTGQVRWRETVEWFGASGVTTLYEIGAGKVLTGLARRIDKNINGVAVNGPADIDAVIAALNG